MADKFPILPERFESFEFSARNAGADGEIEIRFRIEVAGCSARSYLRTLSPRGWTEDLAALVRIAGNDFLDCCLDDPALCDAVFEEPSGG